MSILVLSAFLFLLGPTISQSEDDAEQISMILRFYEVMTKRTQPTVAEFFSLFGPNNEAELALVFNRKFPSRQWNKDPESIEYSRKMYEQPTQFTSMFLQCIRSEEPSLFSTTTSRLIQFPPEADEDFTRYTVVTGSVGITFVFSQNDPFIETVYLPSGKSIDTLTDTCEEQLQDTYDYLPGLKSEDLEVRKQTLRDLGVFISDPPEVVGFDETPEWHEELVVTLVELSHDPDPEIRAKAIGCLRFTTDSRMIEPMTRGLEDPNDEVRATAAAGFFLLSLDDHPHIIERLERLLSDPNKDVRRSAANSLLTGGTKDSLIVMQKRLEVEKNPEVREMLELAIEGLQKGG